MSCRMCALQKCAVLREAAQPLQMFESARGKRLQQQYSSTLQAVAGVLNSEKVYDAGVCHWTAAQRVPAKEVTEKLMTHAQRLVNRHLQGAQHERLVTTVDDNGLHSLADTQAAAQQSAIALAARHKPT